MNRMVHTKGGKLVSSPLGERIKLKIPQKAGIRGNFHSSPKHRFNYPVLFNRPIPVPVLGS